MGAILREIERIDSWNENMVLRVRETDSDFSLYLMPRYCTTYFGDRHRAHADIPFQLTYSY